MNKLHIILFFFLFLPSSLAAQQFTSIERVNVVDVVNGKIILNQTVLVKGNIIEKIGKKISIPAGAIRIKAHDKYLIPGLIDTHLHLGRYARSENYLLKQAFNLLLANGVTGFRDAGSNSGLREMLLIRDSINQGKPIAPKIYLSAMTSNSWMKRFNATTLSGLVDTFSALGVDGIKIKRVTYTQAKDIMDAAKKHHLPVYGHTYNAWENETTNILGDFTSEAISYGIGGVMHSSGSIPTGKNKLPPPPEPKFTDTSKVWAKWWLYFDKLWLHADEKEEKAYIQKLISHNLWFEPTLNVESTPCEYPRMLKSEALKYLLEKESVDSIFGGAWMPAPKGAEHDTACLVLKRKQLFAKRFYDAGGWILAGTDGILYGYDLKDELEELAGAGIPAAAVLKIATYNNAKALGWLNQLGTIEPGKIGSLVLLNANPLKDISNIEKISAVIINGRLLNRKDLDLMLMQVAKAAQEIKTSRGN